MLIAVILLTNCSQFWKENIIFISSRFRNIDFVVQFYSRLVSNIVSRRDWLGNPANIKVENNSAVGYVGSSLTVCSQIVTEFNAMFLLVIGMLLNVVNGQLKHVKAWLEANLHKI